MIARGSARRTWYTSTLVVLSVALALLAQMAQADPRALRSPAHLDSPLHLIAKPRDREQPPGPAPAIAASESTNPLDVDTLAGSGADATLDGNNTSASFRTMGGVAIVGDFAYVGTLGSIRKVDLNAPNTVTTLAGHATLLACTNNTNPTLVRFKQITDIVTDGTYLYTTSACGTGGITYVVRKTSIATGATSDVANVQFAKYLTLGPDGMLYVTGNQVVYKVNPGTGSVTTFATLSGVGTAQSITSDETYLWLIWSPSGSPNTIERFALDGSRVTWLSDSTLAVEAIESFASYLYVMANNRQIRRYVKADQSYVTVAGSGSSGYQDGVGTDAWLSTSAGLASDSSRLLIADNGNRRLRIGVDADPLPSSQPESATTSLGINLAEVTTPAGNGLNQTTDGNGTSASFRTMGGVVVVGDFAYVGTMGSIRKVQRAGLEAGGYGYCLEVGTMAK